MPSGNRIVNNLGTSQPIPSKLKPCERDWKVALGSALTSPKTWPQGCEPLLSDNRIVNYPPASEQIPSKVGQLEWARKGLLGSTFTSSGTLL